MTLTEQWKKGELEKGYYYVKGIRKYDGINVYWIGYPIHETERRWIVEVLAPVPSYEEYNRLKEVERKKGKLVNVNYKIKQENQQLKELLKECKETIYNLIDDEPCWHDLHGYCQAHGWMSNDICPNEQGKNLLTKIDNAIGEK